MEFSAANGRPTALCSHWDIRDIPEKRTQLVEEFLVNHNSATVYRASLDLDAQIVGKVYKVDEGDGIDKSVELQFKGLLPTGNGTMTNEVDALKSVLLSSSTNVQWLTSLRATPSRWVTYPGGVPTQLKEDGGGALAVLAYDEAILAEVSTWFSENLDTRIEIINQGDQFQIALANLAESPLRVPLVDVGEGLVQVMPVLVAAGMATIVSERNARILAIEEPESHLHPKLHGALARRFCQIAGMATPPQIVLETHSENILLEVQLQIALGKVDPDRVIVYWVRHLEDGRGTIEEISFDEFGRPTEEARLPHGVFAEDLAQARRLLEIQKSKVISTNAR